MFHVDDGRQLDRVYVERIRPLRGVRAFVSGSRCSVAGLDVGRLGSDVVATRNELVYLSPSPDSHLMVVSYTIEGDTFRADLPQKSSEQPIEGRPAARSFDVHPDGDRIVASGDLTTTTNVDKVVLVSNFLDDVRRRLSDARR